MGSLSLLATVATVPTLVRVSHRLHALIAEKSLQADTTILTAGLPPRATVGSGANRAVSVIASKLSGGGEGKDETTTTRILNRLDIKADRLRIAIFPDHFNEGEVFRMDAGDGINARLVRGVQEKESIHRDLHLFLGSFSIRKVDHRKISTEEEKSFRIAEWYGLFKESTERNIFTVPTTTITMESDQKDGSNRLVHSFAFTTDGNFDLALNVRCNSSFPILLLNTDPSQFVDAVRPLAKSWTTRHCILCCYGYRYLVETLPPHRYYFLDYFAHPHSIVLFDFTSSHWIIEY